MNNPNLYCNQNKYIKTLGEKFIDDIKKNHGGDIVFFAMTVDDYELMAFNTQEIKRYINQLGEVIVYYRNVTINDDEGGAIEIKVEKDGNQNERTIKQLGKS